MAIHIHTFNYLNDAHVLEQNVDFNDNYVLAQDPSLEMRIVYLVAWFFSQALAYLGIQISMGNNQLLASLLDRHLDHLMISDDARNRNRVALCENLQAVREQEFVTDDLEEKISSVQRLATTAQITFIEHLEAADLVKCTQLHQLRSKAFVTEELKDQIDESIDALFTAHVTSIEEAQGTLLDKCEQLQALKGQPFASQERIALIDAAIAPLFEAHVASIRDSAETFAVKRQRFIALGQAAFMNADRAQVLAQPLHALVATEVTRIEQSDDELLVKYQNLHALTELLRAPGPFHDIDAAPIQAAKLRVLEAIPKKEMVEQGFFGFFQLYLEEIDTYSENLELYTFFMNRFVKQFVELLNHNYQQKHNQITSAFNVLIAAPLYLGYIEAMKNSGQFNSAKGTSDSFKDLVTQILQEAVGEEISLAKRSLETYVPFQNLSPLVVFSVHNQENMAGLEAAVRDVLNYGCEEEEEEEAFYHEESLVELYETHANRIGAAERAQLADWISEALIHQFVSQQTAAGAELVDFAEIPPALTKAHHFINAYNMIKELNPNGDFALFAAGLDGLSIYLQTRLQWITGDFDEWFARPLGLLEADEDLLDQGHKNTWFGQEVFRSFNYDLIKAFNGEQGELQDWVNTNLDTIIGNPMFLFRQELLQKWAGEELLARADESIIELLDDDTLVGIYRRDVAPFVQDVTSIFRAGILEDRKDEFDFRKKAHLSIFQTALRGWAGFQFPELDLSQGAVIDQQRIVVENLVERLPAFFDLDRLMAPIQMDIGRSDEVIEELRAQQATEAERLSLLAIAAGLPE